MVSRQSDLQRLLEQTEWLRHLATRVCGAQADYAADAVQDTWAAALKSPPDPARPIRPWLSTVIRNFVRKHLRRSRAVAGAGAAVTPALAEASAEALLESAEAHRILGELVLALDEPYRTAILLRYYQGLEPAQIAAKLEIPAGTVRWRLSEATRRLRSGFEARHSKKRDGRQRAVWPISSWRVIMTLKAKSALVIASAALIAGALHQLHRRARRAEASPAARIESSAQAPSPGSLPARKRPASVPSFTAPPDRPATRLEVEDMIRSRPPARSKQALYSRLMMPAFYQCYMELTETDPDACQAGTATLRVTFKKVGQTSRVVEAAFLPPPERPEGAQPYGRYDSRRPQTSRPVLDCMLRALKETPFPAPEGETELVDISLGTGGLTPETRAKRGLPPARPLPGESPAR